MKNLIFFFLLILSACQNNKTNATEQAIIPKDVMIDMLVDFAILDASVENDNLKSNKAIYQKKLSYYVGVFEAYQYTEEDFHQSYEIYSNDLIEFDLMYDQVLEKLSIKEAELNLKIYEQNS